MIKGGKVRGLAAVIGVIGMLGGAYAQETSATAPATQPPAGGDAANMTPAQMAAAAKALLPTMDKSALVIRRELTMAREQKDIVKSL